MHCHTLALMRTLSVEHMVQALFTAGNVLTAMRVLMTVKDTQSPTLLDFHVSEDLYHTPWHKPGGDQPKRDGTCITHPGKSQSQKGGYRQKPWHKPPHHNPWHKANPKRDGTCITHPGKSQPQKGRVPAKATAKATASQCSRIFGISPLSSVACTRKETG